MLLILGVSLVRRRFFGSETRSVPVTCNSGPRMMVLMVVAAGLVAPAVVLAVPPRRLARRGVSVVPPPGAEAVVVPTPGSAPVVVGPALRPRRRMLLQPGPAAVPGAPSVATAPGKADRQLAAPPAATAKAGATAAATAKPAALTPEQIPTPRPAPAQPSAGQPTVAATAPAAEMTAFTSDWYAKHPQAWRPAKSSAEWNSGSRSDGCMPTLLMSWRRSGSMP